MTTFVSVGDGMPDNLRTVPDKSRAVQDKSRVVPESLWALGNDGTLWQINPLSRSAMPVINLAELPLQARRQLQRLMLLRWSGPATSSHSSIMHLGRPKNKRRNKIRRFRSFRCTAVASLVPRWLILRCLLPVLKCLTASFKVFYRPF